jgi:cytochrome b involved in lipid metabolism
LSTKNIYFKIGKLTPKFISLFKIIKCIKEAAYKLKLLSIYNQLHNVFNVNLLKKYYIQKVKEPKSYSKKELPKLAKDNKDQK